MKGKMTGKMPAQHKMPGGDMMAGKKHMMPDMPPKGMGMGMMDKGLPPKKMKGKKGK